MGESSLGVVNCCWGPYFISYHWYGAYYFLLVAFFLYFCRNYVVYPGMDSLVVRFFSSI